MTLQVHPVISGSGSGLQGGTPGPGIHLSPLVAVQLPLNDAMLQVLQAPLLSRYRHIPPNLA